MQAKFFTNPRSVQIVVPIKTVQHFFGRLDVWSLCSHFNFPTYLLLLCVLQHVIRELNNHGSEDQKVSDAGASKSIT
jgi:hypothetical protein